MACAVKSVSPYDGIAGRFTRDRALPDDVAQDVRDAVVDRARTSRPRLLDLGAGSGRIGLPFWQAGDDYVAADLSFGMLREFARQAPQLCAVQADGHRLPFGDATFDAVMLMQVFGGLVDWQQFASEAQRVLRAGGVIVTGRTLAPPDGLDRRMKRQLDVILGGVVTQSRNARAEIEGMLGAAASHVEHRSLGAWLTERTPRQFIARHREGARFATLPDAVKDAAIARLSDWAETEFGALDAPISESHSFELQLFRFERTTAQCRA